jgi:sec-independent protein translocase protein TatC
MAFSLQLKKRIQVREMNFIDHLEELRWHIIRSLFAVLVMAIVIFIFRNWVFDNIVTGPINPDFITYTAFCRVSHWLNMGDALCMPPVKVNMQSNTFGGQFLSTITMCTMGGLILGFPYIFWEFWCFVKPSLKPKELRSTRYVIGWVSFFFFSGATFGYFLLGPFTFNFLAGFQLGNNKLLETRPTLSDYFDNLINIILGCGLAFELPVLASLLTKLGLVTPVFLKKSRKYAIIILLLVAAIITPSPDWMSQLIVFLPLWTLYEISIILSVRITKAESEIS